MHAFILEELTFIYLFIAFCFILFVFSLLFIYYVLFLLWLLIYFLFSFFFFFFFFFFCSVFSMSFLDACDLHSLTLDLVKNGLKILVCVLFIYLFIFTYCFIFTAFPFLFLTNTILLQLNKLQKSRQYSSFPRKYFLTFHLVGDSHEMSNLIFPEQKIF